MKNIQIKTYKSPCEMPHSIVVNDLTEKQLDFLSKKWWSTTSTCKPDESKCIPLEETTAMINKILSFGGHQVIINMYEEDLEKIMTRGVMTYGNDCELNIGRASECHSNSSVLWSENDELSIATGYALSDDGYWRQHSWCVNKKTNKITETTEERLAYYGFTLTEEEADEFYFSNY